MANKTIKYHPEEQEANDIAFKYMNLRRKVDETGSIEAKAELRKHEQLCIDKFKKIVNVNCYKYKKYSNYQDLRQDGFEALFLAMKSYNYTKGNFSWWAGKYISTRIARAANAHSTIRIPLKKAKDMKPWKVTDMPEMVDSINNIVSTHEVLEEKKYIKNNIAKLKLEYQLVVNSFYGLDGFETLSISNVAKKFKIPRKMVVELLDQAHNELQQLLSTM